VVSVPVPARCGPGGRAAPAGGRQRQSNDEALIAAFAGVRAALKLVIAGGANGRGVREACRDEGAAPAARAAGTGGLPVATTIGAC
jgi:hypothetical protein